MVDNQSFTINSTDMATLYKCTTILVSAQPSTNLKNLERICKINVIYVE